MVMDTERFEAAKLKVLLKQHDPHGFGTLREKTVHAVMKLYYEPNEDNHEVPIEGYIADIYNGEYIIEIQNGNFNKLRPKLATFLPLYKVMVVYPIPHNRWLIWMDEETGELSKKHKSPKTGSVYLAFNELCRIKPYLNDPNISFAFPLIDMEEYRLLNGWSKDRKKGSDRYDRMPTKLYDEIIFERKEDFLMLVPITLEEEFTIKDFAMEAKIHRDIAAVTVPVLVHMGILEHIGKRGREYLYRIAEALQ